MEIPLNASESWLRDNHLFVAALKQVAFCSEMLKCFLSSVYMCYSVTKPWSCIGDVSRCLSTMLQICPVIEADVFSSLHVNIYSGFDFMYN